ncbi:CarD family transcriptional regulator [Hyphomicrobium methylovorum]|uniref:CarD family transcriptional regulator n=1 Tax=Hyphomicrobium methylovorum TaxID=84 RepID=UPI0015E6EC71|nr:CarD family transcriptional regulator [Hyphomicrobium methylovorum]MBA2126001.1 CarD family transcriptional regulator [Hyphomicrobium methylovorum]
MAQKKKAPVSPKSAAKPAVRRAAPLKVTASAQKTVKQPVKAEASKAPVAKAKTAAPAAAAKATAVKKPVAVKPATKTTEAILAKKPALAAVAAKAGIQQRAMPAGAHKPAGQKVSSPLAGPQPAQPVTPKAIAEKAAAAKQLLAVQKKPVSQRHGFKANEFVVYPAHGVGRIVGIEEQEIAGMSLELFVITFDKEKLTLRVPTGKLASVGMRKLADEALVKKAMETLKGRARVKRTMWSRRAQEYVAKINSGDLISIAEVVRDLYRSEAQPEQSYSERQLYEDALDRMARELAAVEKLDERGAVQRITDILSKSAKGRRLAENEATATSVGEAAA